MPNMDYSLIQRTPDGTGKILVTTPGIPNKGSYVEESDMKNYVNQDVVKKTDIAQSLGQQDDKVPSNKAVDDSMNLLTSAVADVEERVTDIEQAVESGYKYKGDCTYANLPTSGQQLGDLWYVTDRNDNYVWNGSVWRPQNNVGWAWVLQADGNYKLGLLEH